MILLFSLIVVGIILSIGFYFYVGEVIPSVECILAILIGWFVYTTLSIPVFLLLSPYTGGFIPNYSTGIRSGYITQLSEKGVIYKTNEGQLQLGQGSQASLHGSWNFSIDDTKLLSDAQNYLNNGSLVKVKYTEWVIAPAWISKSGYIITDIEVIDKE